MMISTSTVPSNRVALRNSATEKIERNRRQRLQPRNKITDVALRTESKNDRFIGLEQTDVLQNEDTLKLPVRKHSFRGQDNKAGESKDKSSLDRLADYKVDVKIPLSLHDEEHRIRKPVVQTRRKGRRTSHPIIIENGPRNERPCMVKSSRVNFEQRDGPILRPYRQLSSEDLSAVPCIGEEEADDTEERAIASKGSASTGYLSDNETEQIQLISNPLRNEGALDAGPFLNDVSLLSPRRTKTKRLKEHRSEPCLAHCNIESCLHQSFSYPSTFVLSQSMRKLLIDRENTNHKSDEINVNNPCHHERIINESIDLLHAASDAGNDSML